MAQESLKDKYANVTVRDKSNSNMMMNKTSTMPPPPLRKKSISRPGSKKKHGLSRTLENLQTAFKKNEETKRMKSPAKNSSSGNCGSQILMKNQPTASQPSLTTKPATPTQQKNVTSNAGLGSSSLFQKPPPANANIGENKAAGGVIDLCQLKNDSKSVQQVPNPVAPPNSQDDTSQPPQDISAVSMPQQNLNKVKASYVRYLR